MACPCKNAPIFPCAKILQDEAFVAAQTGDRAIRNILAIAQDRAARGNFDADITGEVAGLPSTLRDEVFKLFAASGYLVLTAPAGCPPEQYILNWSPSTPRVTDGGVNDSYAPTGEKGTTE